MNKDTDNSRLVEAMRQYKAEQTLIFREEFYKAVVEASFFVPLSIEKGTGSQKKGSYCVMSTKNGQKFLCAFSSSQELEKCYGDRNDIVGTLQNFALLREIIVTQSNNLDGLIIDPMGENVGILKEDMLPKK